MEIIAFLLCNEAAKLDATDAGGPVASPATIVRLRVGRTLERSLANGPGERFVVWVQGCSLACLGCFNPGLQASGGRRLGVSVLARRILAVPGLRGVTLSGGEPMEQPEAVAALLDLLRPALDSVVFTGYTLAEARADARKAAVLARADLVVAGRYRGRGEGGPWGGSTDKEIAALTGRIRPEEAPACPFELHLRPDGSAFMTGFPPPGLLYRLRRL